MKKIYIAPSEKIAEIDSMECLMALSGELGEEVEEDDVRNQFTKELTSKNLWDNEW